MPCAVIDPASVSSPNIPGIGGFSIPLPDLNIPFPTVPMPDLSALYDILSFILPIGTMKPNFEPDFLNDIYGAINDLLSKFMPFLMLYKFFLPVLNLILCIIEVLCALTNPFKLINAIIKLFRQCIPEFLALFPFFALILMIISLILLIITLIEYLIERIINIILIIIENILALGRAAQRLESDSIIAILKKVGDLLCFLQNLFVILGVILLIIQIIKSILTLSFKIPPCDSSDSSDNGCCTPDVCPDFIKNNDTITSSTGTFLYFNQVGIDSGLILPTGFPPIVSTIRQESWQFYDPNLAQNQAFINITHAYDLPAGNNTVFFPSGTSYTTITSPSSTPYTINFRFFYNPATFGISDPLGARYVKAVNVIVQNPPTTGVSDYDGHTFIAPFNGTLNLIGGVMTEDNDIPILTSQNMTIPLNTFIHLPLDNFGIATNDGILFPNLTYTFSINHEILLTAGLITLGCIPEVAASRDFINTTIGAQFNMNGAALSALVLPDVAATQECLTNAISTFRSGISIESSNKFQTDVINCLNDLKAQATTALSSAINAGFDQYKSDFSLSQNIQFTTSSIQVYVSLNESSGQLMTTGLPTDAATQLAAGITGDITLGSLSPFAYDGYNQFVANLTSTMPGTGSIKVAYNNNFISILSNPIVNTQLPSVTIKELDYTFIDSPALGGEPRRDLGDVGRDKS